jgi:hypothetical protein
MNKSRSIEELLNDKSHHIEFNGHLTNHVKHAVVALVGLGASPDTIQSYYENYAEMTPYGYGLEPARPSKYIITDENWKQDLGKRTNWSSYCAFFERKVNELGLDEVIRRFVPVLLPGWAGAFTHATIHLGWALNIKSQWMAIEGLAYMAYTYVPCYPERALSVKDPSAANDQTPIDSLLRLAREWENSKGGLERWVEGMMNDKNSHGASQIHPELVRSGLQFRIAKMLHQGHASIYRTPAWIFRQDPTTSFEQLYYVTALLYRTIPGDFVLLHFITSLHAMEQISLHLPSERRKDVVHYFWIGILCVMFAKALFPKESALEALHSEYQNAVDANLAPEIVQDWDQIVGRAILEAEEHNPKMVYILKLLWTRTGYRTIYRATATHFTTTPELPKSFEELPADDLQTFGGD